MRTLRWNCRGLGIDSTVRRLKEINRMYLPDIICLSETKQQSDYVRDVGSQLGFLSYEIVPPVGVGGGLVVYWKQNLQLSILSQSVNLVDCQVVCNEVPFYFSFVYGHPNPALRHHTWEKLTRLGISRRNQPWFALGDFNEIRGNHEKIGGRLRSAATFQNFNQMMRDCDFTDLHTNGNRFSWVGQRGTHVVQCCLDRTMANTKWLEAFPASHTDFLEIGESDHRPLITFIAMEQEILRRWFRFDSRMISKDGFEDSVKRGWNGTGQGQLIRIPLAQRLSRCRQNISQWKRHNKSNAAERILVLRNKLDKATVSNMISLQEKTKIREELNQAYLEEEIFWKQKSRLTWLRSGDRNTRYFHAVTRGKRIRNTISSIQDSNGVIGKGQKEVARIAEDYFNNLYTSVNTDPSLYRGVFQGFQKRVTNEMNEDLLRMVTEEEVRTAIFDMGSHRTPGPDGFSAIFYQRFWEDTKTEIMQEVISFFNGEGLDSEHNHTNLCLIPKIYPPTGMAEFRPIALCNVSYKIISKILVNRLKSHLSGIITENQTAFIPGRIITDNIVVAHEIFHSLKARKRQALSYMAVKTDITKAYDRLEWSFLEETMRYMGFDERWIRLIMSCITSVSYSVLINGSPEGYILPQRGIRQGDPLSPYLFILCAEVLSHMMNQALADRSLLGIKIANQAPPVNHLLFADDSLFFSLANKKSALKLKKIFKIYEDVSGQSINLSKSSILFGNKVKVHVKTQMRNILGIHNEGGIGKYLGLPEQFGNKKSEMFTYIIEKVKSVTQSWKQRHLSTGGKEVLLKSIVLAMPIFSMNVFRLPKEVCEEINSILAKFWWGKGDRGGMHWYAWNRVCVPKREGGLGFRDLEIFNQALLGKQVWRILQNPSCLMARILKARYFPDCSILEAVQKKKASYAWKSILYGKELVSKGMRYIIGDGSHIKMWNDPWLPDHPPRAPRPRDGEIITGFKICDYFKPGGHDWDEQKLRNEVLPEDVIWIMKIKISPHGQQDLLGWSYNEDGLYTVKSGYWLGTHLPRQQLIQPTYGDVELKQRLWKTQITPKIKHFVWRILSRSLATGENLRRRHVTQQSQCRRCGIEEETDLHLFFNCPYAQCVWRASGISNMIINSTTSTLEEKIAVCLQISTSSRLTHFQDLPLWILWRLWKSRNILIFQQRGQS